MLLMYELAELAATRFRLPTETVDAVNAALRNAGMVPDFELPANETAAARLLLALMVSSRPDFAVQAVNDFGVMTISAMHHHHERDELGLRAIYGIESPTLESALTAIIGGYADPAVRAALDAASDAERYTVPIVVTVTDSMPLASITIGARTYQFAHPTALNAPPPIGNDLEQIIADGAAFMEVAQRWRSGIRSTRSIATPDLIAIGEALAPPSQEG